MSAYKLSSRLDPVDPVEISDESETGELPDKQILMSLVSVAVRSGDPTIIRVFADIIKEVWDA